MISKLIKKNKTFFLFIIWLSICLSINLNPQEFFQLNLISKLRLILPFLLSLIFILFSLNKIETSKQFELPHVFFYLIFFSYLCFNLINDLNSNYNLFWPIIMFLSYFVLQSFVKKNERILILKFTILILVFVFLFFLSSGLIKLILSNKYHLYGIGLAYSGGIEHPPRSSGLARLSLIIYGFLIIYYLCKNNIKNYKFLFLILFFAVFTLLFQSRTTSFIFILVNLIFFVFYTKRFFFDKRLIFFSIILPFFINLSYTISIIPVSKKSSEIKVSKIFELSKNSLIRKQSNIEEVDKYSSGRFGNWSKAVKIIKKKPLNGYGAQADRIYIKQSIHNSLLYSSLSGGLIASVCIVIIYFYSVWFIYKIYFVNHKKFINNVEINFCILLIIILNLRSILETSFAIFSIDFLIYILAFSILNDHLIKNKNEKVI